MILLATMICSIATATGRKNNIMTCLLIERFASFSVKPTFARNCKSCLVFIAFGHLFIINDHYRCH